MQKMRLRAGLCPGPHWGSSRRSPDPLVGWGGTTPPRSNPLVCLGLPPVDMAIPLIVANHTVITVMEINTTKRNQQKQ